MNIMPKYTIATALAELAESFCIEDFVDEKTLVEIRDGKTALKFGVGISRCLVKKMKEFIGDYYDTEVTLVAEKATDKQIFAAVKKHINEFAKDYLTEEEELAQDVEDEKTRNENERLENLPDRKVKVTWAEETYKENPLVEINGRVYHVTDIKALPVPGFLFEGPQVEGVVSYYIEMYFGGKVAKWEEVQQ